MSVILYEDNDAKPPISRAASLKQWGIIYTHILPSDLTARSIRVSAKSGSSNVNCPALLGSSDGTCRMTSDHTDLLPLLLILLMLLLLLNNMELNDPTTARGNTCHGVIGGELMTADDSRERRRIDASDIV